MAKQQPNIDINQEYANAPGGDAQQAPVDDTQEQQEQETDIPVSADQLAAMKQLAAAGKFQELGQMVAQLLGAQQQ